MWKRGRDEDLPSKWFDANDQSPYAQISGDGRLVSTYMESGANDSPMIVNVYDGQRSSSPGKRAAIFPLVERSQAV